MRDIYPRRPNPAMQRMRASRSRQSRFERCWRLARPADGDRSTVIGLALGGGAPTGHGGVGGAATQGGAR
jgi:hypothetical protein